MIPVAAKLWVKSQSVIAVLETRFSALPDALSQRINAINDLSLLKHLHKQTITISSLGDFVQMLTKT